MKAKCLFAVEVLTYDGNPKVAPDHLQPALLAIQARYRELKSTGLDFSTSKRQANAEWLETFLNTE